MDKTLTIINPKGTSLFNSVQGSPPSHKEAKMAKRRKKKSSTRRRRSNPSARVKIKGKTRRRKTRRISVYKVGRGKKARLYRSARYKLRPRRVNRRRRRRNPAMRLPFKKYFGQKRLMNALALIGGIGIAAWGKSFLFPMISGTTLGQYFGRGYGALSIVAGVMLSNKSRRENIKKVGNGMVAFGIYDLLVSNFEPLQRFLPAISPPLLGSMSYGRSTYGAGVQAGPVEVVGANISAGIEPEIVGHDYDLADALEMGI